MIQVTYRRKGSYIDPEPVSIEFVPPHTEFDPDPLIKIIARRLVKITKEHNGDYQALQKALSDESNAD
jgi:hypothetical protein